MDPFGFQAAQLRCQAWFGKEKGCSQGGGELAGGDDLVEIVRTDDDDVIGAEESLSRQ